MRRGKTRTMTTQCISCHFEWEEEVVLPLLPWWDRWMLRLEHRSLARRNYPAHAVLDHAEREMVLFRKYAPQHVAEADAQHERVAAALSA